MHSASILSLSKDEGGRHGPACFDRLSMKEVGGNGSQMHRPAFGGGQGGSAKPGGVAGDAKRGRRPDVLVCAGLHEVGISLGTVSGCPGDPTRRPSGATLPCCRRGGMSAGRGMRPTIVSLRAERGGWKSAGSALALGRVAPHPEPAWPDLELPT